MKWFAAILALPVLMLTGALLLNRPPLWSPPGPLERLKTYLTTNMAETRSDHRFAELRTPLVRADVERTRAAVLAAMQGLGWREIREEPGEIRAVVVSSLLQFRDDVRLRLEPADGGTLLHVRSSSRLGKGDLAANARHLRDLFAEVGRLAGGLGPAGQAAVAPASPRAE